MILELDTISSTMDYAREILRSETVKRDEYGKLSHQAVMCKHQTNGRGQRGREWVSLDGSNLYSTILYQNNLILNENLGHLSIITGASVAEAIYLALMERLWPNISGNYGKIGIKWPNDILLNTKKVGGILIEMEDDYLLGNIALIGIGINLDSRTISPELSSTATSFILEHGFSVKPIRLLQWIIHSLERITYIYKLAGLPGVLRRWKYWDLTVGMKYRYGGPKGWIGTAEGIDENGLLMLRKEDGTIHSVLGATHLI